MTAYCFNVLKSEAEAAVAACKARGVVIEGQNDDFHLAMLEELDRAIPGSRLLEREQAGDSISIAVVEKLPDARLGPDPRQPIAKLVSQAPEPSEVPDGMAIIAARVAPTPAFSKKLDAIADWQPLPAHQVKQMQAAAQAQNMAYPTHQGILELDGGKAKLKVYQLSNGQRVVDASDLQAYFSAVGGI